ncbi:MAG TPA: ATP-binding protein [Vicinamibacterales bacterium]|nr:ATP-binding protein [Vicinamibacterales bacterium]
MPAGRHTHVSPAAPAVGQVAGALDAFCAAERLPEDVAWRLRVALDEIVANIVAYSGPGEARSGLDVWFRRDGGLVEITVADDGPAFDPLERPDPDVTLPLEARQPGGLGIALVKSLMDEVHYERTTRNVLTIRKRIETGPEGAGAGADEHPTNQS